MEKISCGSNVCNLLGVVRNRLFVDSQNPSKISSTKKNPPFSHLRFQLISRINELRTTSTY